jgi:hypothetical protein
MKWLLWTLLPWCFIASFAQPASVGKLVGTANGQDGQQITQGRITAIDVMSGKAAASTDIRPDASYAFQTLPEGVYYLTSQLPGFRSLASKTVILKTGDVIPIDLVFQRNPSWFATFYTSGAALWSLCASLVLTLWGPRIYAYMHRPKLCVDVRARPPHSHWINPQFPPGSNKIDIFFCRLNVSNQGKTEAEKVEVSVRNIFRNEGRWVPLERFVPLNLRWSNTWDIVKAGEDVPGETKVLVKDRISAGGERLCDLGFVVDPSRYHDFCQRASLRDRSDDHLSSGRHSEVRFLLAFEFIRDLERHRMASGHYLLEIVADAIRIRPKSFWIELEIPSTVAIPMSEEERLRGLHAFRIECHEKQPTAMIALTPERAAAPAP